MATININLAVTPVGSSIAQGVNFAFTPGAGTPANVVSPTGGIDLSKLYPAGIAVVLAFQITTPTLKFTSGSSIGTFPLSFVTSNNGAKDAMWIAVKGTNPGVYGGNEFVFGANAMGPGNGLLTVTDNNDDGLTYTYALWVWAATQGVTGQRFEDDPHVVNHPSNK
jgi:hypothetical protein